MSQAKRTIWLLTGVVFTFNLSGCATSGVPAQQTLQVQPGLGLPQRPASSDDTRVDDTSEQQAPKGRTALTRSDTPSVGGRQGAIAGLNDDDGVPPMPRAQASAVNVQGIPLHVFASEVFGNILGLTIFPQRNIAVGTVKDIFETDGNLISEVLAFGWLLT